MIVRALDLVRDVSGAVPNSFPIRLGKFICPSGLESLFSHSTT